MNLSRRKATFAPRRACHVAGKRIHVPPVGKAAPEMTNSCGCQGGGRCGMARDQLIGRQPSPRTCTQHADCDFNDGRGRL